MRLLTEGFETVGHPLLWSVSGSPGVSYNTSNPRINGTALQGTPVYRLQNNVEFFARFAYIITSGFNASIAAVRFTVRDANNLTVLRIGWAYQPTPGPLAAYFLGATQPQVSNSLLFFPQGWSVFEVHFRYTTQALPDNFELRRNGVTIMTHDGATQPVNGAPSLGTLEFGGTGAFNMLDDIAINDTTGTVDNSWCGDGHVVAVRPNGNGDASQMMGSDSNTVNNFELVREAGTPNRTNFVESDVSGQRDLYAATDITIKASDVIRRVQMWADARKQQAVNSPLHLGIKSGGGEHWSADTELQLDWAGYVGTDHRVNPATGNPWMQAEINALQIGVRIP